MTRKQVSFTLLTGLAILTLFSLLLWRQRHFSSILLLAIGMISWGVAFMVIGRLSSSEANSFEQQWTFRGAMVWLGMVLFALGVIWVVGYIQGKAPSSQVLLQEFIGFSLAYIVGLIFYRIFRLLAN